MADAVEEAVKNQGLTSTLKDLFAGAVGGVAQVLIGTHYAAPYPYVASRNNTWNDSLSG